MGVLHIPAGYTKSTLILICPPVRADRPQSEGVDMSEARLSIRTDSALKEQARRLYESMGLDLTTAVNMFLRQSVVDHGMPFKPTAESPEDINARREDRMGEGHTFATVDDMMDYLDA